MRYFRALIRELCACSFAPLASSASFAFPAQALLGREFKVTRMRGELLTDSPLALYVMATVHPASILRAPDDETRQREMELFVDDLKNVAEVLKREGLAA
jgi:uracil-DNA glycosylase